MANRIFRLSNGVSFGARYTVQASDVTDGYVNFGFKGSGDSVVSYPLVGAVTIVNASDIHQTADDVVITYPSNGYIRVASGATFKLVAGMKISVVAQRADIVAE